MVAENILFKSLDEKQHDIVLDAMFPKEFEPGDIIIKQETTETILHSRERSLRGLQGRRARTNGALVACVGVSAVYVMLIIFWALFRCLNAVHGSYVFR